MNANKALWELGDFTKIAEAMRESGAALVSRLAITPGLRVIDLGCGDGTTAIPAAQLGAHVRGIDIASNLVAAARRRARAADLAHCAFEEGDASNLENVDTGACDLLVTIFGAMFAPNPLNTAKEMVRVTKPGGRIVMGNWIPGDPTLIAQILKTAAAYSPPPPEGFISPTRWGVEADVVERFGAAGVAKDRISFARESYVFDHKGTPQSFVDLFQRFYGPTMKAFQAAEAAGRDGDLRRDLDTLFAAQNISTDPAHTRIPATYLQVTVAR